MPEPRPLEVADVEALLAELSNDLTWPSLPDAVAAARNRIAAGERARRHSARLPWLAWAAIALGVVVVAVLALPGPRSAVADLFGLGGVQVRQLPSTVPLPPSTTLDLGQPTTLSQAAQELPFQLYAPTGLEGEPAAFTDLVGGRPVLSLVYPAQPGLPAVGDSGVGLLVSQFAGSAEPFIDKVVNAGQARRLSIDGRPALWVRGPHTVFFEAEDERVHTSEPRLSRSSLVVTRDGTTVRFEGDFDEATAIELARSLTPVG